MTTTKSTQPEAYWKVSDVARFLAVSPQWVYKHAELGTVPCHRFEGNLRFKPSEIYAYADRCAARSQAKVIPLNQGT